MMDYLVKLELQRQNKTMENLLRKVGAIEKKIEPKVQLLDSNEVCKQLLVSERTLAQWRKDNVISYLQIGKTVRFTQEAITEMVKRNEVKFSKN